MGFTRANNPSARRRRNRPVAMQQRLKSLPRSARARIVAAELLDQFLVAMDEPQPALDPRLTREALTPLRGDLESRGGRRFCRSVSFRPPEFALGPAPLANGSKTVKQ